jgi:site-specific DNA recombinase
MNPAMSPAVSSAAIYARVSSARQKEQQTIDSQIAALHAHAEQLGLEVAPQWVFSDDGHSGATLVRPALEKLRDLVAQVPVDVVLVYSPDRLARKYAYQALLIEELAKAGTSVMFVHGPRSDTPEDALLVQFQGMIAEYERAQIIERTRRGKTHRARQGTVNVLSGAPFGYRYVRKNEHADARYEVVAHEAAIVTELFRRYVEDGVAIAELARWLSATGVATRTGKPRWDRSVIWGMLRNPAYAGRACFGKTMRTADQPGLNRTARLAGRATPKSYSVTDRPTQDWLEIPVPALVTEDTWARVQRRLADNKRFAARHSKVPSLLQGLTACSSCGYAYYRGHTTTTAGNKIYYYRCLGSDNYRYQHGRVCDNKPVRTDYLDNLVWDHVTGLLADPRLIRAEIDRRLDQLRTADPTTAAQRRLEQALAKTTASVNRLIKAYQEELISLDELRERTPELRSRETSLRGQLDTLADQLVDRQAYLKLATGLEDFLARLRGNAATATVPEQQRVLRLLIKDVLIGPERILIRHSIPTASSATTPTTTVADSDTDEEPAPSSPLRWRSHQSPADERGTPRPGGGRRSPLPRYRYPHRERGRGHSDPGEVRR